MNIVLGNIIRNTKRSLEIEVKDGNKVIGSHKFDKDWCSHNYTSLDTVSDEDLYDIFEVTKELIDIKRKELS